MAAVPICSKMFQKDTIRIRQYNSFLSIASNSKSVPFLTPKKVVNLRKFYCMNTHKKWEHSSDVQTDVRQLKALDAYLSKIDNKVSNQQNSSISMSKQQKSSKSRSDHGKGQNTEELLMESSPPKLPNKSKNVANRSEPLKAKSGLGSLGSYFGKLKSGISTPKNEVSSSEGEISTPNQTSESCAVGEEFHDKKEDSTADMSSYISPKSSGDINGSNAFGSEKYRDFQPYDEGHDLALINLLISINIAVIIFEIASPIKNTDVAYLSLPLAYGAKINHLILDGEWWRLHSGFLHVALGCWVLLTFGPQVCRVYGSFTFFLIYVLGGISGNLSSFFHTPELTVGGTGPVFATLGAWFVYQIQNKELISKEESERMLQKAVITTLFSLVLNNFELVDDWTHLGAVLAGLIYGFLTCPTMQMGNASPRNSQDEGIAIIRRQAGPCRSFIIFTIIILILSSLLLLEPQLGTFKF
ncbi:RHOMBOID-like protein 9, chloroplastic isoform X2 [Aristolochia californica]|uniref:RHOMBOID-like protein 9, chloroplastic isoform X2 n=1 Tax=Aristolochia californica TaxID=171875 RepID=UPI0035E11F38